jgi:hypothetical protein
MLSGETAFVLSMNMKVVHHPKLDLFEGDKVRFEE